MSTLKAIYDHMFSPRLIKIYGTAAVETFYQPYALEKWGNQVIHSLYVFWRIGVYTSPLLIGILYQRDYFTADGLTLLTKFVSSIGFILVVSYCCRGLSRHQNPVYRKFIAKLQEAQRQQLQPGGLTPAVKRDLLAYDFDFDAWPVEFSMLRDDDKGQSKLRLCLSRPSGYQGSMQSVLYLPIKVIAYLAIHSFGIRLIYPGMIGFLQIVMEQSLLQGRTKLIQFDHGERFKLQTLDNNEIDAMFIDRRGKSQNGSILVICSEGNAGYYEIGIMTTPIEAGYSVLGWNHPGFGGSTGAPYPPQEENAIDTVVQFAIIKLGFMPENIMLFGWSIGGYSSSWAAMNYPDIKGLVIDATFDDILPLALNHMPSWWEPIVRLAIREHVNLDVYQQLSKYPGPVFLIRRTDDEVICLRENDLSSNRGNDLLIKLLHNRYPCLLGESQIKLLNDYLAVTTSVQDQLVQKYAVNDSMCQSLLQSYISEYSKSYPMKIGEEFTENEKNRLVLFLARKYMRDFKSSHCVNLPAAMFQQPWDVNVEKGYVFT